LKYVTLVLEYGVGGIFGQKYLDNIVVLSFERKFEGVDVGCTKMGIILTDCEAVLEKQSLVFK
jgi:hypothetical protein